MFYDLNLRNLIFIDIETTMVERDFTTLPKRIQEAWKYRFKRDEELQKQFKELSDNKIYERLDGFWKEKAALYPEFAKVVCISIGGFNTEGEFKVKDFREGVSYGGAIIENELGILQAFKTTLDHSNYNNKQLIAHNGKNFDYPFLIKRFLINNITPSKFLWIYGKKPWEVNLLDSQEIWQFGAFKSYTSLDTIASTFNLPSPKADMDGSEVWKYYYDVTNGGKIDIGKYCNNDVICLAQVMMKMVGEEGTKGLKFPEFIE